MRNLKKALAVITVIALLATMMMVPALAATSNDSQAAALKAIGLFKGVSDTNYGLEGALTRAQAMAFIIRAEGKEDEALAMSEADIATELAKVADGATIAPWARPYAAYALKTGVTTGEGVNGVAYFKGDAVILGPNFVTLVLRAMGYTVDWTNPWDLAVTAKLLTPGEAVALKFDTGFIRDDAVGILYSAVKSGVCSNGKTLVENLIAAGAVDAQKAYDNGFVATAPAPEALTVESVTSDNLAQFVVTFSDAVDEDDAKELDNYELETDGTADLAGASIDIASDAKSVTVTLADGKEAGFEEEATLTVSGIAAADDEDTTIEETDVEFTFTDVTFPTVLSAEVVGNDTIKVTFSEPIGTFDPDGDDFELDGGDYVIDSEQIMNNRTEINVVLYSDLEEGTLPLKVFNSLEDYAGYNVKNTTVDVTVVEDTDPPVITGYKDASNTEVTLIFDQDIEIADADDANFYHTNSNNVTGDDDGDFVVDEDYVLDGNELTLYFTTNELPNGTSYVFIAEDAINDLWDNENDKLVYKIEVEEDVNAPTLDDLDVDTEDQITLTFSEDIDDESFDEDSFTLLDEDGTDISDQIQNVAISGTDEIVVTFDDELDGDYTIVIEEVEDLAGNEIAKTSKDFTVKDMTAPLFGSFDVTLYNASDEDQMIKVDFDEEMAVTGTYSVLDLGKYLLSIDGTDYDLSDEDIDAEIKIVPVDDNEAVEIYIASHEDDAADFIDIPDADVALPTGYVDDVTLTIGRVADADGNYTKAVSSGAKNVATPSVVTYEAEATDVDTVVVSFDDKLTSFDKTELAIYKDINDNGVYNDGVDTLVTYSKLSTAVNSDGETEVTYTLPDASELHYNATTADNHKLYVLSSVVDGSKNQYGELVENAYIEVTDSIVPALAEDTDLDGDDVDDVKAPVTTGDTIVLTFEENLDGTSISTSTFEVGGGDYEVTGVAVLNNVVTLTIDNDDHDNLVGVNVVQQAAIRDDSTDHNKLTGLSTEVGEF